MMSRWWWWRNDWLGDNRLDYDIGLRWLIDMADKDVLDSGAVEVMNDSVMLVGSVLLVDPAL